MVRTTPLFLVLCACLLCLLPACSWAPSATVFSVRSIGSPNILQPTLPLGFYRTTDQNTADLYLTDIPLERLTDTSDRLTSVSGTIVHVHIFLIPAAGKTPIDATACNTAVRQVVLSQGAVGIYGGGGFLFPSGSPGDATFGGEIAEASMRLVRATRNFDDLLGPSIATGTVRATLDERAAQMIATRVDTLARATPEMAPPQPAGAR